MKYFAIVCCMFFTTLLSAQETPVSKDSLSTVVQVFPEFPGGQDSMINFIYQNIKYPPIARENGISGLVVIEFIIDTLGNIKDASILKDIGAGCGEEALRVINTMPRWTPAYLNGQVVEIVYKLPITFNLEKNFTFIKRYRAKDIDWSNTTSVFIGLNSGYSFYSGEVSELVSHEVNYIGLAMGLGITKKLILEFDISLRQSVVHAPLNLNGISIPTGRKLLTSEVYLGSGINLVNTNWFNLNTAAGLSIKDALPPNDLIPEGHKTKTLYRPSVGLGMDFKLMKFGFGQDHVVQQVRYPVIRLYSRYTPFKLDNRTGGNLYIGLGLSMGASNFNN